MDDKPYWDIIQKEFDFLLKNGFSYEYTYDKASDKSCVYIYRFTKLGAYIDLRQTSGGKRAFNCVVYTGEYRFPKLELRQKKLFRDYRLRHLFKKETDEEFWGLYASVLQAEIQSNHLYGIPVEGR